MCRDKKAYFYLRTRCMADHWPEEFPNVNIYRRARRKRTLVPMFVSVIQREARPVCASLLHRDNVTFLLLLHKASLCCKPYLCLSKLRQFYFYLRKYVNL